MPQHIQNIQEVITKVAAESAATEKKPEDLIQLVVFALDKEEYAAHITDVQEIIRVPEITPIPNAPDFIRGILNLRGKIVVVIDLEKRFHLTREHPAAPGHIIIAEVAESTFGVMVDQVTEVLRVPVTAIQPTPALVLSKIHAQYLKGVVVLDVQEPTKELTAEECKRLLAAHQTVKAAEQSGARLLILLDLPKMLQAEELLELGEEIKKVGK